MMILLCFIAALLCISSTAKTVATAIDVSPGVEFVPMPDPADPDNTLINYKARDEASVRKWTSKIDEFFNQYTEIILPGSNNVISCSHNSPATSTQFCDVPLNYFGPCNSANRYNYDRHQPCVFLKLEKLLNWTPNPYNTSEDLPTDMPEALKQHINNVSGRDQANTVWVSCEGENPADVEFMGPIQYFPKRGFPTYYFPYTNQEGYLSPLVAVYFERPRTDIVINIECKAWAKNIVHDKYQRRGSVHFELMVDA